LDTSITCRKSGRVGNCTGNKPNYRTEDSKKNNITSRKVQYYVIPPKQNGEFVAGMETVLDLYEKPRDPDVPVVAMDEQSVQLLKEIRQAIAATPHHAKRVDYTYERAGVANIFMFTAPLECWRRAAVRERKTKIDWAHEVKTLLEEDFPKAKKVVLVCDNLNTHTIGALYEAFDADVARSLARRLEIVHTPKHGSWLNVAENDLSALTVQCVKHRRFGSAEELRKAVEAWAAEANEKQKGVKWQFTTEKARVKLVTLYPKIKK